MVDLVLFDDKLSKILKHEILVINSHLPTKRISLSAAINGKTEYITRDNSKVSIDQKEIETFPCPGCKSELPTTVASCPICGWVNEAVKDAVEEPSITSDIPEVGSMPELPVIPVEETLEKKEEAAIDEEKPSWTFGRITVLSLIIIGFSLAHYGL
ncbi:unnamed protein product, partial [marine sediment metagenome]